MGLLDDAVPGGNISKPLLIALGVLLAGKMFGSKTSGEGGDDETSPPSGSGSALATGRRSRGTPYRTERGTGW